MVYLLTHSFCIRAQKNPIKAVIPPNIGFQVARDKDSSKRLTNIRHLEEVGRQKWQKETKYGRRSGVENAMYRHKTIIGRTLRSRNTSNQNTEIKIGVNILNRMKALGIPKARAVA